ncbi:uncharacterized protein LOC114295048 [Camellia sinensis]|uniref:uncharacterized protein LOC114295048 n=1 Tax=Camellia sinensis TaxID=4442 RepID=UPI001036684B|nr:uncharacterized protein LOC114295048 [Camellia sinensis]
MDGGILLVCSYGLVNVIIRLHQDSSFVKIVDDICEKFDGLVPGAVCLFFDFPQYKKFKVDSDDDIQNMLCLAKSFGINHIEVLIQESSVGVEGNCGVLDSTDDGGISRDVSRNGCMDKQMNLLPTYCPNKSKMFLSAPWAYGITHVGQCFDGGATKFREVLCNYVVERGFQFKYIKNDFVRITVVCKFAASTDCSWSVHARMLPSSGVLCVKSFDSVHTCGVVVPSCRNPRTGSDLVSTDVVFDLKNEYGLDISYRVAWYFISFRACIDGFNHCRPLLFLDGTFLKGRFKGNLLAATAKKANQGLFPVAFAIVDSENSTNWEWGRRYGEMCSNATESFNNWVGEARRLPITRLVDMIRGQIMEQMSDRQVKCTKWASVICLKMEKKLVAVYNDSRAWCVSQANDDVYEVHSHPSVLVDVVK